MTVLNNKLKEGWRESELRTVVDILKGKGLSRTKLNSNGKNKCILYGELFTRYAESIKKVFNRTDCKEGLLSEKGDVLLPSSTTTVGRDLANATVLNEKDVLLGGDIIVLRINKEKVDGNFLAYYLTHFKKREITRLTQGITIIHLYGSSLGGLKISLPSLKIQQEIVKIFSRVDEDIEATNEVIKKIEKLKKGLMQDLLTKGIGHKKFKETKLGMIPENWEVKRLEDLCESIKGGGTPARKIKKYWDGDINWATVKDLKGSILLKKTQEKITLEGVDSSSTCIIPKNNIITSTRMGVGRFYINGIDVAINQDLKGIILKDKVDLKFMFWKLLSLKERLESLGTGTTVKGIRVEILKNLELAIPKIIEQKEIAEILSKVDEKIEIYQEIRLNLEKLKKGLMQDLLK